MKYTARSYCNDLFRYSRLKTYTVEIAGRPLGGDNPVRIQTMTNCDTNEVEALCKQFAVAVSYGADYVRVSTPGIREVESFRKFTETVRAHNADIGLIADIHFNLKAAERAAECADKIRINPGNLYDTRAKFEQIDLSPDDYCNEIDRIAKSFAALINLCKKHRTAIRIGTNQGSLSDRIMSRYGNTPEGMVAATMEFLRICCHSNFTQVVVSLKSSNVRVMVQACRLLVSTMKLEGLNYPLHLGVTEAGNGDYARIKSAVGIGALLADGIGDTIRVSLTEPPENELPVARQIVEHFANYSRHETIEAIDCPEFDPYEYKKRATYQILQIGGNNPPVVIADMSAEPEISHKSLLEAGFLNNNAQIPDFILINNQNADYEYFTNQLFMQPIKYWKQTQSHNFPLFNLNEFLITQQKSAVLNFISVSYKSHDFEKVKQVAKNETVVFMLKSENCNSVAEMRAFFLFLLANDLRSPVIICKNYNTTDKDKFLIASSCDTGILLLDGFGDGLCLSTTNSHKPITPAQRISISFGILQASRVRVSETEYIACPTCARTLYDIEKVLCQIRERTSHLTNLKIAVMGCIVNGPGEMADADYGYVGAAKGKVSLYKGKTAIQKNIPENEAVEKLVELIKANGDWKEK